MITRFYFFLIIFFLFSCETEQQESRSIDLPMFSLIPAEKSHVNFINNVIEDESFNIVNYVNSYNGGGVALLDINNDGLQDIFFTGNMVTNKLFLNKGNLHFEDISSKAGIEAADSYCTGVTIADINLDGWMDLYVCRARSDNDPKKRENLLYINNQDNTFTEAGASYGVNDNGYTSQATFFDYDLDGDLDLYVGNFPRNNEKRVIERVKNWNQPIWETSDHFYENNGDGSFTDKTVEAGVLNYGWTLGLIANDFNHDGLVDIYVCVDHDEPDNYYINQGNGTFKNATKEGLRHLTQFAMGIDGADFNNDGYQDFAILDMLAEDNFRSKTQMAAMSPEKFWALAGEGYHFQYMRNLLQLNDGNNFSFSEIGYLSGITSTDWSWALLAADFDNDGWKDIFVTNGYLRDVRDNDFFLKYKDIMQKVNLGQMKMPSDWDIVQMIPKSKPLTNYFFRNNGDLTFEKLTDNTGLGQLSFSNGAAYGDLDNDGDLDLIVNNLRDSAFIYRNNTVEQKKGNYLRLNLKGSDKNPSALNSKVYIYNNNELQYHEHTLTRGFQSSTEDYIHFGLGSTSKIDSLRIIWSDGNTQLLNNPAINQTLSLDYKNATDVYSYQKPEVETVFNNVSSNSGGNYAHRENEFDDYQREVLLPHKMSQHGPALAVGDVNNDNLEDYYVGGAIYQPGALYLQTPNGNYSQQSGPWDKDYMHEETNALFFDKDNDGDLDLYVSSGGNEYLNGNPNMEDRLYENTGSGQFIATQNILPSISTSSSCVTAADFDKDGDLDLFIGGRQDPGLYPRPGFSYLLRNDLSHFTDITEETYQGLNRIGMVTSAVWSDFDKDEWVDLIIVGEWMDIKVFRNNKGKFELQSAGLEDYSGWWNRVVAADIDKDGDDDYILGNLGLNYKYKASEKEPFEIFATDFDNNGKHDIVLGYYYDEVCYPVRGRTCSIQGIPSIKQSIPSYDIFAKSSLQDIYGEGLENALHLQAKYFSSAVMINNGSAGFEIKPLPIEAQFAPVQGIIAHDFDKDDQLDILIAGNLYVSEVETGRADAGSGLLLKGNGNGDFTPIHMNESGFFAARDVRDLALIMNNKDGRAHVLVANNNSNLQVFELNASFDKLN